MSLAAPVSTPPLLEGDSLTSEEFLRSWEEMTEVKHADIRSVMSSSPVGSASMQPPRLDAAPPSKGPG